jgi:thiamine-phosphate pyrophosphorylase
VPATSAVDPRAARLDRLATARLYLVCDAAPAGRDLAEVLPCAIAGGVDVVQLRVKDRPPEQLLAPAQRARAICTAHGALFIVNDHPAIACESEADGVHVGQDDMPVPALAASIPEHMLIGLSTHAPAEIDAADPRVDYIGVGPVHATPTKLGRPAVGTELVRYAAARARVPFFAIGGIDAGNVGDVLAAGATRVCVLRAIADAADPGEAARELRRQIDGQLAHG